MADVSIEKNLPTLTGTISAESVSGKALTVIDPIINNLPTLTGKVVLCPHLAELDPTSAAIGEEVTITGKGFGETQGASYVTIGEIEVTDYTSWSDTEIVFTVPAGAETEDVRVWRVDSYE